MKLFQHVCMMIGIISLLSVGCDNSTEFASTGKKSSDKSPTERSIKKAEVSPAVEGAHPAATDREKDMALVASETHQHKAEQEAIRKDMENISRQTEKEQTAPE